MDKILDDMRKKFETEQKQVVNEDELMPNSETDLNKQQQLAANEKLESAQEVEKDQTETIANKTDDVLTEKVEGGVVGVVVNCDYIETSTPCQSNVNESEMMTPNTERAIGINNMQIDQIDSIKSNNRDNDSSDDKTNELSDTAEEIETFTRKETTQYRVLSMPEQNDNNNSITVNSPDQISEVYIIN